MRQIQTVAGFGGYSSDVVSKEMLGTNMLFHTDRTGLDSDFRDVIAKIGTEFVRFPGGTITELYFDITDPNSTERRSFLDESNGADRVRTQDVTTLSEYLSLKAELEGDPVVVVPTYRYFDGETGLVDPDAEGAFRGFIRNLLSDEYGAVDHVVIELGNEFYQSNFDWSLEQFAALQAEIAGWIDDEARALGQRDNITLLAQAGRSLDENTTLADEFNNGPEAVVDGVLTHFYGTNSNGDPLRIGGGVGDRLEEIHDAWTPVLGDDFNLAVTEWNVGESGESTTLINGIMRSAPLLRMYAEMLEGGVDMAMIWSAQTKGPAGLSGKEGQGSDLSPTGYLYSMLAESTEGLRLVDQGSDFKLRTEVGETLGYTYTFDGAEQSVTYFASGVNDTFRMDVSMAAFADPDAYVYARILDVAPGQTVTDYWSDAAVSYVTNIKLSGGGKMFSHEFNPYQLVELHVVSGAGITLAGDSQSDIDDRLTGSEHDDRLFGNSGDDRLVGAQGTDFLDGGLGQDVLFGGTENDKLFGGTGDDFLYGGRDSDTLQGGDGDDRMRGNRDDDALYGQSGRDVLFGGAGNDVMHGGSDRDFLLGENGNDQLDGGTGNDNLFGGGGRDAFVFTGANHGYDRVMDFRPGEDVIDLSAFELADFLTLKTLASNTEFGLKIDFDNGNVVLVKGLAKEDMDVSDFLL